MESDGFFQPAGEAVVKFNSNRNPDKDLPMNPLKGKSIVSLRDLSTDLLLLIIKKAAEVKKGMHEGCLAGKVLATLFFEPSTRTRLSFESAMRKMGGEVIGFTGTKFTSIEKGENLIDTIRVVSGYCDVIVMRHPLEGSARLASEVSSVPVINGGDGANQHPTQTFLDLFTISEYFGGFENLKVAFLGDLKYGRTVHSLAYALSMFGSKLYFVSPEILRFPDDLKEEVQQNGSEIFEFNDVEDVETEIDVLYVTRIQKERFGDIQEYRKVAGSYRVTPETVEKLGGKAIIMHPLPRVNEISPEVDKLENAIYFKQAHNGIFVRSALLGLVLGRINV